MSQALVDSIAEQCEIIRAFSLRLTLPMIQQFVRVPLARIVDLARRLQETHIATDNLGQPCGKNVVLRRTTDD
jgi:hypothetical protein